jgi:hypothetical protein
MEMSMDTPSPDLPPEYTTSRIIQIVCLSWLTMLGIDFLVHGGLLENLYAAESAFLLPAEIAFQRIPLGYLSFLILAIFLVWLVVQLRIMGIRRGFMFGLMIGFMVWGALILGLFSISTANSSLLLGWWIGQSVELAAAGSVAGYALAAAKLRRVWVGVLGLVFLLLVLTVLIQNIG